MIATRTSGRLVCASTWRVWRPNAHLVERTDDCSRNAYEGLVKVHPILTKRPGDRFEARVVRSRPLTPTTHGIELEKPAHFTFQPTQFTFLQLETSTGLDVRPMSLATSSTRPHLEYGVRLSDSDFKRAFAALQPGDTVVVPWATGTHPRKNGGFETRRWTNAGGDVSSERRSIDPAQS